MNETTGKYQNKMLNCEKALACILVIILHCEFPTIIGSIINIVARVGVPLFFMTSGFFSISQDQDKAKKKLRTKVLRTLKLVVVYYVLNICYDVIVKCWLFHQETISQMISILINPKSIKDAIVWNRTLIGIGGWFLPALMFCYGIVYFLYCNRMIEKAYKFIIPLFIGYFIISRGMAIPVWYSRNYLFDGLPFFLIGAYCSQNKERIDFIDKSKLLLLTGGIGIGCVERFTGGYDLYVGVIIAAVAIFAFAIKNESYTLGHCLEFIGENLTLNVYLIHPLILQLLYCYEDIFNVQGVVYEWCRPVIVIIVTLTLSKVIYILQRKITNNARKKL